MAKNVKPRVVQTPEILKTLMHLREPKIVVLKRAKPKGGKRWRVSCSEGWDNLYMTDRELWALFDVAMDFHSARNRERGHKVTPTWMIHGVLCYTFGSPGPPDTVVLPWIEDTDDEHTAALRIAAWGSRMY